MILMLFFAHVCIVSLIFVPSKYPAISTLPLLYFFLPCFGIACLLLLSVCYCLIVLSELFWPMRYHLSRNLGRSYDRYLSTLAAATQHSVWHCLLESSSNKTIMHQRRYPPRGNPLPSSYRNKAALIVGATILYTAWLHQKGVWFCNCAGVL